ncbi:MAG: DUF4412 domain-containing protein [Bacteroidota bacterium]
MKKLSFIIIMVFIASFFFETNAQPVGRFLEKKMKQATNRAAQKADEEITDEMNKQVDKGVENVFEDMFGSEEESENSEDRASSTEDKKTVADPSDAMAAAMMKKMGLNMAPANVQENYDYQGNILMTVQSWDQSGETEGEMNYTTHYSKTYSDFAMEFYQDNASSTMIFDTKNGAMLILTDNGKEKTGIVTSYAIDSVDESSWEDQEEEEIEKIEDYSIYNENLKKTGKTKKIAGYKCDEYRYEDEEDEGTVWMTHEISPDLWARMVTSNVFSAATAAYYGGFVMEMDQTDKNTGERTYMLVKEVNENKPSSISTRGYQLMSLNVDTEEEEEEEEE